MTPTTATSRLLRTRDGGVTSVARDQQHEAAPQSGLAALARKLRHPLSRIRGRALENLLFKLREDLLDVASEPVYSVDECASALVSCLDDNELEAGAIQVLQLLLKDDKSTRVFAPPLRKHGLATALQRGAVQPARADLQATHEALLHRLLATTTASQEAPFDSQASQEPLAASDEAHVTAQRPVISRVSPTVRVAQATVDARRSRVQLSASSKYRDPLTSSGWRFPHVALAAVDEQSLFEFEVKWRLRTSVSEIVEMCDTFRRDLLRDYPPETFLQRPAMFLRVLELVQQPIVPAATTPELSFGVNYFDEPASPSFTWKPSIQATALHVSSLKAIESWIAALRHAAEISLNPVYHTFQSSADSSPAHVALHMSGYDHRRLYYPRVETKDGPADSRREDEDGLSVSGAAYLLIVTLMRLLVNKTSYPRLHLLNIIHAVTDLLPERSISSESRVGAAHALDKERFEMVFAIFADVQACRESGERSAVDSLVDEQALAWFIRVLRLLEPSSFVVEGQQTAVGDDITSAVVIPSSLWSWMLQALVSGSSRTSDGLINYLVQIDSSVQQTLLLLHRSQDDAREIEAVLLEHDLPDEDQSPVQLSVATRVLEILPQLSEDKRRNVNRVVLRAICHELEMQRSPRHKSVNGVERLNSVVTQTLRLASQGAPQCRELALSILDQLVDWIVAKGSDSSTSDRLLAFIRVIAVNGDFMESLLCYLAASVTQDNETTQTLWRLADVSLRGLQDCSSRDSDRDLCQVALSRSVAILQHFAYADSQFLDESSESHRHLQRTFVRLVHQVEVKLSTNEQLLLVSRCLVHRSAYIRKAAATGLFEQLVRLVPSSGEGLRENSPIAVDPFGQFVGGSTGDNQRRVLENEIPSLLQPRPSKGGEEVERSANGAHGSSSLLLRVTRLRKLLSNLSIADGEASSAASSTLHQLLIDIVQAGTVDFTVLHEAGEVDELIQLLIGLLARSRSSEVSWFHHARGSLLSLVRVLLMRSGTTRGKIRGDTQRLALLLSFAFEDDASVRAEVYFVVLALTCTVEAVLPSMLESNKSSLEIPAEFSNSFGLFSSRWSLCGISVRPLSEIFPDALTTRQELPVATNPDVQSHETPSFEAFQELWTSLSAAKSYRTFLDVMYQLAQASFARQDVRDWIQRRWEDAPFRKYLETPPTSAKDRVIMAAVLALVNTVFDEMTKDLKMDIVLLLRRFIIPLELAVDGPHALATTSLSIQLARLLLHISRSEVAEVFVSMAMDAGLAKKLGGLIVGSSISSQSSPLQRVLWIEVSTTLLDLIKNDDSVAKDVQQHVTTDLISPLRAIAGRHRVPGSFQDRDSYVRAIACLAPIDILGNEEAIHWFSRLVFDCSSTLRALGFAMTGFKLVGNDETEDKRRVLRLIVDAMRDETDSDAVRSAAARVLFQFLDVATADTISLSAQSIDAERLVAQMMHGLVVSVNNPSGKCSVRIDLARVQLLRLFISQHEKFASTPLEKMLDPLLVGEADEFRSTHAIVKLLSVRRVFVSYQRHCLAFLNMQPGKDAVWWQSILPTALRTIAETARLVQALLQPPLTNGDRIITESPLLLQLVETLSDVSDSLQVLSQDFPADVGATRAISQHHYEALDECGKLLALVATVSPGITHLPIDKARLLLQTVTSLQSDSNPKRFRLSFARTVAAIFSVQSSSLMKEALSPELAVPLGASLWMSFRELSEQQPTDANSRASGPGSSYLPHLRRVAFALQVLISRSTEASSALCDSRFGAAQLIVRAIKSGFVAIRMSGGFGAKTQKTTGTEAFIIELCASIQLHCQVLSGFFVNSSRAQDIARDENLCSVFAANWNVMRVGHRRGSSVLLGALRLLQNYAHRNEANKRSITTAISTTGRVVASDNERSLLDLVGELALGPGSSAAAAPFDERWSSTAGTILKSAFLHIDCLHGSIKSGLVTRLFGSVVDRSKRYRQTVKPPSTQEELTLVELLGVLASVASSDEGRQVLLQQRELKNAFDDVLHFAVGSDLMLAGSLFVRNMAFSKFSKSHFAVWEPVIDQILSILSSVSTEKGDANVSVSAGNLSTALLSVIFDNQRAQAVVASSQNSKLRIQQAIQVWRQREGNDGSGAAATVSTNLTSVQSLLASNSIESERP